MITKPIFLIPISVLSDLKIKGIRHHVTMSMIFDLCISSFLVFSSRFNILKFKKNKVAFLEYQIEFDVNL